MALLGDLFGFIDNGRAAKSATNGYLNAENAILTPTKNAQDAINSALTTNRGDLNAARDTAISDVNTGVAGGNKTLNDVLQTEGGNLNPYLESGAQGNAGLQQYVASNPHFRFTPSDYFNSPAYKFQLDQGTQAIQNSASANGLGNSGSTLKNLTEFGQGLASTYYNQAFNQAQSTFQTNQNTTLQNLQALINTGEFGTNQYNGALENFGNRASANTVNAGYYGGNANLSVADLIAGQNLQGQETSGEMGMRAGEIAGQDAIGAGAVYGQGILNQGKSLGNLVGDGLSMVAGGLGGFATGGWGGVIPGMTRGMQP